jgi:CDP-6-deoxy-D-xylo-4-hexulose-3-dehydrase
MPERLNYAKGIYGEEEKQAVRRSLDSGWLSNGLETLAFEREFADWWGVKHALSVNSGSSANLVALQSLGLPKNSEVITPAGGAFPTTVAPMIYLGLKPVFVDVKGLTIDPDEIEKAITKDTKAILFAHTLGQMPDMRRIMEIAGVYGLKVMEDCCDCVGSRQEGEMAGTFGDVATVSFYPAHHMTTGEGGMVITNNSSVYREALSIRDWGRDCTCRMDMPQPRCHDRWANPDFDHRYYYSRVGLNFKMNEMTAAFGREQLKRLDGFIEARKENYKTLYTQLGGPIPYDEEISPFAYPLYSKDRRREMEELERAGIETRVLFAGNILEHPAYKDMDCRVAGSLPQSDRLFREAYFVGVAPHLTRENMLYIANQIRLAKGPNPIDGG